MDPTITNALHEGGIADITTVGRKSGLERRIEIYFHHLDGEFYVTGRPGHPRDWLANMKANPEFTLHLKRGVEADLQAEASEVTDLAERRLLIRRMLVENWGRDPEDVDADLDRWVDGSPLVRFEVRS